MKENLKRAYSRRDEAKSIRFEGYETPKLKAICKEESVPYGEFLVYAKEEHLKNLLG